jgi:phosphoribosylanthranilate isomerase
MDATRLPRIKICCIASEAEAWLAIRCGASALGLVSAMPSGPGPISDEPIREIRRVVPPGVATFLLTCRSDAGAIVDQLRFTGCNTVQICDELGTGSHADIREALPNVSIVQVIHVQDETSIQQALDVAPHVDAILLDSGRPNLAVKELGGTGRVHDWGLSRRIREVAPVPVYLAGGLNPNNVGAAVRDVGPFGLDVCSGVRTNGLLDEVKLRAFVTGAGYP